jgi:hypothetical protein
MKLGSCTGREVDPMRVTGMACVLNCGWASLLKLNFASDTSFFDESKIKLNLKSFKVQIPLYFL